jgi:hypothetical protein
MIIYERTQLWEALFKKEMLPYVHGVPALGLLIHQVILLLLLFFSCRPLVLKLMHAVILKKRSKRQDAKQRLRFIGSRIIVSLLRENECGFVDSVAGACINLNIIVLAGNNSFLSLSTHIECKYATIGLYPIAANVPDTPPVAKKPSRSDRLSAPIVAILVMSQKVGVHESKLSARFGQHVLQHRADQTVEGALVVVVGNVHYGLVADEYEQYTARCKQFLGALYHGMRVFHV